MKRSRSLSGPPTNITITNRRRIVALSLAKLLMFSVLSVGCGTTHEVGDLTDEMSIYGAAAELRGEEVTIENIDGHQEEGTVRTITLSELSFTPDGADSVRTIPLEEIRSIKRSAPEILAGAGIGGLAGCLVGAWAASPSGEDDMFPGLAPAFTAGIGGLAGCGVGILVGATRTESYVFTTGLKWRVESQASECAVFVLERDLVEESATTLTIPWKSGRITLSKADIWIEEQEDGTLRITVPLELLERK